MAKPKPVKEMLLPLEDLRQGTSGITPEYGACLEQAASVCLTETGHISPTSMAISGDVNALATLTWTSAEERAFKTWNDDEFATEQGAYGVATLLVAQTCDLEVVERSKKGTGFDYWLGPKGEDSLLFQRKARLEVSGLRRGNNSAVEGRVRTKLKQTERSDGTTIPAVVIVVEFGTPQSRVRKK